MKDLQNEGVGNGIKITALLCDAAQESGGKLHILGGGWSVTRGSPVTMALALKLSIPWVLANTKLQFSVTLVDEDGELPTLVLPDGTSQRQAVAAAGELEVGRPAGLKPGTPLDSALAVTFHGVPLQPGRYVWNIAVDDDTLEEIPFTVLAAGA